MLSSRIIQHHSEGGDVKKVETEYKLSMRRILSEKQLLIPNLNGTKIPTFATATKLYCLPDTTCNTNGVWNVVPGTRIKSNMLQLMLHTGVGFTQTRKDCFSWASQESSRSRTSRITHILFDQASLFAFWL